MEYITFKNCKSLRCIPVIYTMLHINYIKIKKKNNRHTKSGQATDMSEPVSFP